MKFVFVSHGISPQASQEISKLVGKHANQIKILFIDTPAKTYPPNPPWLVESKQELIGYGYQLTEYDIEAASKNNENIKAKITRHDAVFISGGNTFYFLYWAKQVGLKEILLDYLRGGGVYMGESTGVVCQIKDLEPIKWADDPKKAPEIVQTGMQLTDLIVIPHWNNPKYQEILIKTQNYYQTRGFETHVLRDGEIMIIDGPGTKII